KLQTRPSNTLGVLTVPHQLGIESCQSMQRAQNDNRRTPTTSLGKCSRLGLSRTSTFLGAPLYRCRQAPSSQMDHSERPPCCRVLCELPVGSRHTDGVSGCGRMVSKPEGFDRPSFQLRQCRPVQPSGAPASPIVPRTFTRKKRMMHRPLPE